MIKFVRRDSDRVEAIAHNASRSLTACVLGITHR